MKTAVWLFLAVAWGLTWLAVRIGLDDLPPITFAGLRFFTAALLLWLVLLARKTKLPRDRDAWRVIVGTGFLTIALPYALQFWGQQYVSSGLAAVMFATVPLFALVFAHVTLPDDPFTPRKATGVLLGIVGVAVIFSDQLGAESALTFWGCVGFLVGAATHALAQVLIKAQGKKLDPLVIASSQIAIGGTLLLAIGITLEGNPLHITWTARALASLAYLAIVGSALCFFLLYWLLRHVSVTTVTSMSLAHPVVAVLAGWIVLGEQFGRTMLVGSAAVLAGLALIVLRPTVKDPASDQLPTSR